MGYTNQQQARFDARLTKGQKELFETAARISGFKSLSEFVIHYIQEKSNEIIEKHSTLLASEKDKEVFFDALINPAEPNLALKEAAQFYKEKLSIK